MEWAKGEVPGTTYGLGANGWIDMELFKGWFTNHFLRHAVSAHPLLLLLDGHSSHYNPDAIRLAKEYDVILFTLVPHTTHTSVFAPLKAHWCDACHEFMQKNPGKVITKYQFSPLLAEAWLKAMSLLPIISGFKYCGVYPFNAQVVLSKCTSNSVDSTSSNTSESDEASSPTAVDPSCCSVCAGSASESTVIFHSQNTQEHVGHNFTDQEELKFQVRF